MTVMALWMGLYSLLRAMNSSPWLHRLGSCFPFCWAVDSWRTVFLNRSDWYLDDTPCDKLRYSSFLLLPYTVSACKLIWNHLLESSIYSWFSSYHNPLWNLKGHSLSPSQGVNNLCSKVWWPSRVVRNPHPAMAQSTFIGPLTTLQGLVAFAGSFGLAREWGSHASRSGGPLHNLLCWVF